MLMTLTTITLKRNVKAELDKKRAELSAEEGRTLFWDEFFELWLERAKHGQV